MLVFRLDYTKDMSLNKEKREIIETIKRDIFLGKEKSDKKNEESRDINILRLESWSSFLNKLYFVERGREFSTYRDGETENVYKYSENFEIVMEGFLDMIETNQNYKDNPKYGECIYFMKRLCSMYLGEDNEKINMLNSMEI